MISSEEGCLKLRKRRDELLQKHGINPFEGKTVIPKSEWLLFVELTIVESTYKAFAEVSEEGRPYPISFIEQFMTMSLEGARKLIKALEHTVSADEVDKNRLLVLVDTVVSLTFDDLIALRSNSEKEEESEELPREQ